MPKWRAAAGGRPPNGGLPTGSMSKPSRPKYASLWRTWRTPEQGRGLWFLQHRGPRIKLTNNFCKRQTCMFHVNGIIHFCKSSRKRGIWTSYQWYIATHNGTLEIQYQLQAIYDCSIVYIYISINYIWTLLNSYLYNCMKLQWMIYKLYKYNYIYIYNNYIKWYIKLNTIYIYRLHTYIHTYIYI